MAEKQTYEELEQWVKELEKENTELKRAEEALKGNEEKFRSGLMDLPVMINAVDQNSVVVFWNKKCEKVTGYTAAEMIGNPNAMKLLYPDREYLETELNKWAAQNYQLKNAELILSAKDGSAKTILWTNTDFSKPEWIWAVGVDITARKRVEEALQKSTERYALATKAARVGVWDWNVQTNEFYLDPNVKAILGYSDAEIPNDIEVWSSYVHPDDKQSVMEAFQDHIDGKTPEFAYKHRMLHKDGSIQWIMARGTVIRDDQGNPIRVVGTDTDITQYQQAEEALREKDGKLERQAKNLIEVNTALKVLLEQREKEKTEMKENLVADIQKLVYPYIEKLKNKSLNQDAQTFVNIIKLNIDDLISPFAESLSSKYFSLTPSEIQVADLIRHGKTSKEIASILNVSPKAVSFHRGNLRKKLGLLNKKINLRTYLQTFPQ